MRSVLSMISATCSRGTRLHGVRSLAPIAAVALAAVVASGCGDEIGDSCTLSNDCSAQGDRTCDLASPEGYCTIQGCDFDSCPEEAICVRFFPSVETNISCTADGDCSPDELCALGGFCVPRSSEVRFCMKSCGSGGDCRDRYECRTEDLMLAHGGEPVLDPSKDPPSSLPRFCAAAPL